LSHYESADVTMSIEAHRMPSLRTNQSPSPLCLEAVKSKEPFHEEEPTPVRLCNFSFELTEEEMRSTLALTTDRHRQTELRGFGIARPNISNKDWQGRLLGITKTPKEGKAKHLSLDGAELYVAYEDYGLDLVSLPQNLPCMDSRRYLF